MYITQLYTVNIVPRPYTPLEANPVFDGLQNTVSKMDGGGGDLLKLPHGP